mgnify:CR=1 FL=1|tara:strand:- start:2658 stop:3056 length:399 start_codon:yes stop_codon:yes gene_type:complete
MCWFGSPEAPDIIYQGPSEEDIEKNKAMLDTFEQKSLAQQEQFASALQVQIDQATTRAEETRRQIEAQRAASMANIGAQQTSAYAVNTRDIKPEEPKVTKAIKKKKDDKQSTFKVASGSVVQRAGTGLNVGV